jgi:excisionase family DNA binding protein
MKLTLQQAADQLGKTARQVRYLIKSGKLPATKHGNQWRIDEQHLPRTIGQADAARRKQAQVDTAIEQTMGHALGQPLDPDGEPVQQAQRAEIDAAVHEALAVHPGKRRYSVLDLRAFQIAAALYRAVTADLGADHPATAALHATTVELSRGCHRYDRAGKAESYRAARDAASRAAGELAVCDHERARTHLERIEQDLMAALAGLLQYLDRRARRRARHAPDHASAGAAA